MRSRIAGFSLVELMVAVGIIGILAVIAVPRYKSFLVQARRGEAKSNLSHLASLQEVYKVEHYTYYQGAAMTGTEGVGYKDGDGNQGLCNDPSIDVDQGLGNHLGFRPGGTTAGCRQLRYFYQFAANGNAMASAASDDKMKYIYPDCNGYGGGGEECGYGYGDALTMAMSGGKPEVCRNIAKYCPDGAAFAPTPPPPCPTSCPTGQAMHPAPACCQPICPATCPAGQAMHPAPACCQPCSCAYQTGGDTQTPWTPSIDLSNVYTCQWPNQSANFTETWTASSPECAISDPCSNKTYTKYQGVQGQKLPDCDPAPGGITACPCKGSDARACCTPCPSGTIGAGRSYTGEDANGVALDFSGNFDCQEIGKQKVIKSLSYTPARLDCPDTLTQYETACGTNTVECDDVIRHSHTMTYGECQLVSGDCKKTRTYSWQLKSPCADASAFCSSSLSLDTCTTAGTITGATCSTTAGTTICSKPLSLRTCPPSACPTTPVCAGGDYDGDTEAVASGKCLADNLVGTTFTATANGATLACECNVPNKPSQCLDHNGVVIQPEKLDEIIRDCEDDGKTWDAKNCACVGHTDGGQDGDGQYNIKVCLSASIWGVNDVTTLFNNIKTEIGDTNFNDGWKNLSDNINTVHTDTGKLKLGAVLKKIRCGGMGSTAFSSHPSVQSFNHLVNYYTKIKDGAENTLYGRTGSTDADITNCSILRNVTWTCD